MDSATPARRGFFATPRRTGADFVDSVVVILRAGSDALPLRPREAEQGRPRRVLVLARRADDAPEPLRGVPPLEALGVHLPLGPAARARAHQLPLRVQTDPALASNPGGRHGPPSENTRGEEDPTPDLVS